MLKDDYGTYLKTEPPVPWGPQRIGPMAKTTKAPIAKATLAPTIDLQRSLFNIAGYLRAHICMSWYCFREDFSDVPGPSVCLADKQGSQTQFGSVQH